jgi:adenylylsulfate kinase
MSNSAENNGFVLWFTGLPSSGKTTLALNLEQRLSERGIACEHLDGDLVRANFPSLGFGREARNLHVKQMGFLASRLEKHGVVVLASFVSPYKESRAAARNLCRRFVEIHVATPLELCEKRDVKGLYRKARNGEISQFTGIDDPYEEPEKPELYLDTKGQSIEATSGCLWEYLEKEGLLAKVPANGGKE